jgi:hypothetical protein
MTECLKIWGLVSFKSSLVEVRNLPIKRPSKVYFVFADMLKKAPVSNL